MDILVKLFNQIWKNESTLEVWKFVLIIELPKIKDLMYYNNRRGISLLSVPGKQFCPIILQRIRNAVDTILHISNIHSYEHHGIIQRMAGID